MRIIHNVTYKTNGHFTDESLTNFLYQETLKYE